MPILSSGDWERQVWIQLDTAARLFGRDVFTPDQARWYDALEYKYGTPTPDDKPDFDRVEWNRLLFYRWLREQGRLTDAT